MAFEPRRLKQYLLSGVSYAIPFVACGGIMIAFALAFAPKGANNAPDPSGSPVLSLILNIGVAAFTLLVPVLAAYIAYGIADRPGLVPGMVGGWIATHLAPATKLVAITVPGLKDTYQLKQLTQATMGNGDYISAGFLGGIVAGLIAGFIALQMKRIKMPPYLKPIMPIMIIPVVSSLIVGFIMYKIVGNPVADLMNWLTGWLASMGTGSQWVLALILGAMIAFDMGGPVNKVAFFFGAAMITKGNPYVMGACAAAICIPPIGLGLATIVAKRLWTEEERESGIASLAMGMIGITEGAIPFAAADPVRVIPTIMIGSMTGAVIAMLMKVGDQAPHGGPIVLPVVINRGWFVVAIVVGSVVVATIINTLRAIAQRKEEAKA
ncbi:MAG TPA: PTS fructose transporter subunit IIC [Armatimonadota bacterium]|jgi:fructose-specific phosphotransferase system IIC component